MQLYKKIFFNIFSLLIFSTSLHAAEPFMSPAWWALLHYEKNWNGSIQSNAIGEKFFLSKDGATNPEAELLANIQGFQEKENGDTNDEHAQCKFPARFLWIKNTFPDLSKSFPKIICNRWLAWQSNINPKGAWIIFASAFINSPASMYGHTLLRFSRGGKTEGNPLLDYALSYGADIGAEGGPAYLIKGLVGSFHGSFTTAPFYLKVQEYNHVENRDFWEYELNLSQEELDLLVAHTWELREASFAYYFLKRNCAYYLLRLLEVARPDLALANQFSFWTIPTDSIRALDRANLIRSRNFRASRVSTILQKRNQLTAEEIQLVENFAKTATAFFPDSFQKAERKLLVLDTAYELFRYQSRALNVLSAEQKGIEAHLLTLRGQLDQKSVETPMESFPPEQGHESTRVGLYAGRDKNFSFGEIHYRGALHDFLSDPAGYESGSELTMGDLRARVQQENFFLEKAEILKIRSVAPLDSWIKKVSWNLSLGMERAKEYSCSAWNCNYGTLDGGAGFAVALDPENFFYLYLNANIDVGAVFDTNWRLGIGPNLGVKIRPLSFWRILASYETRSRIFGDKSAREKMQLEQSFTWKKNKEFRMNFVQQKKYNEYSLGHYWYY